MRFTGWVPAAAALIAISAVPAGAGVLVFSNLGQPGNLYGPDGAAFGVNPFLPGTGPALLATRFTVAAAAQLEAFYAPLDIIHGPADLTAYLMTDANGLPDSVLESIPFANAGGLPVPLTAIPSSLHPALLPGVPYWFAVSTGGQTFANWLLTPFQGNPLGSSNFATGTLAGGVAVNWEVGPGGSTGREGALQVEGLFVPEPSTLLLAGIGLMVLLRRTGACSRLPLS